MTREASKLASRERYLITFEHKEPDRVPIFLDVLPLRFYGEGIGWYNQFERAQRLLELGCDPMINIWLLDPTPHPNVRVKTWRERTPEGKVLLGKAFETPKGALRQVVEETRDWCDAWHGFWVQRTLGSWLREDYGLHLFDDWNVSRRIEPWVKGPEDLPKLAYVLQKPSPWVVDEWRHDAERALEFARAHGLLSMARRTIVCDAFQWFCDIPWFLVQLHDQPDFVREFFSIFEEVAAWQTELALELQPDVFQHRDWYAGPEFWGAHFERHLLPFLNRHADTVHAKGVRHCYLLTEGWAPYLDLFRSFRTDILWGADPVKAGADLATIKERVGSSKAILGGISSEHHLNGGPVEATRRATREAIRALAPGGGFVLASSSSMGMETRWQNIEVMVDEAHRVGRYPISL